MEINAGDTVVISVSHRQVVAKVLRVNNTPKPDGSIDKWDHWDLEYTIVSGGYRVGDYGRWKQNVDGGTVTKQEAIA